MGPDSPRGRVAPIAGAVAGFASGLLGVGGGFLIVPLLVVWGRMNPRRAAGTSLAAILPIGLAGAWHYYFRTGSPQADLRVALLLVSGSVVGAYVGSRAVDRVPTHALQALLAVVLAGVGAYEVLAAVLWPGLIARNAQSVQADLLHSGLTAGAGFLIGILSGLTGVGGGIFVVPTLVLGLGLSQHVAQGTSLLAILPTAAVGALVHHRQGDVDLRTAAWIGGVGAPAALVGASLALALSQTILVLIFGGFLMVAASRLWPGHAGKPSARDQRDARKA
jgi:uncharacterized protein